MCIQSDILLASKNSDHYLLTYQEGTECLHSNWYKLTTLYNSNFTKGFKNATRSFMWLNTSMLGKIFPVETVSKALYTTITSHKLSVLKS